jgi:hypothetical protein
MFEQELERSMDTWFVNHVVIIQDKRYLLTSGSQVVDKRRQQWDQLGWLRRLQLRQRRFPNPREVGAYGSQNLAPKAEWLIIEAI